MKRKIVLFFVFLLFIFLAAKQDTFAATCSFTVSPSPIPAGTTNITIKITSNKSLGINTPKDVYVAGDAFKSTLGVDPSWKKLSKNTVNTDGNGDITMKNADVTVEGSGLPAGTFTIYVFPPGVNQNYNFSPSGADCSSDSDSFTVTAAGMGDRCVPLIASSTDPSNNNAYFDTADTITLKVTDFKDNTSNTDTHKFWLTDPAGNKVDKGCHSVYDFGQGIPLISGPSEGTYTVSVESACTAGSHGCDLSFPITVAGISSNAPVVGQSTECFTCPANSNNYNPSTKSCITPDGKPIDAGTVGYCANATPVCDPILGCVGADGLPVGSATIPTNPPVCTGSADGGYTCNTAIGSVNASPQGFVTKLFSLILSLSGGIALLLIIISGYKILSSQGNPEALKGAREQLTAAIVGLLFIILALVILQIIGVDILHIPGFGSSPTANVVPHQVAPIQ